MTDAATYRKRKEALVAALRSGKYEQGKDWLRKGDAFCCLGVACDISGLAEWVDGTYMQDTLALPFEVCRFYGFVWSNGRVYAGQPLTDMNDSGATFTQIADWIDSEPAGMFTWSKV